MKNNNFINFFLTIAAILSQRVLFQTTEFELYRFPFASGLMVLQSVNANLLLTLYTFIPIPFMLFLFWGWGKALSEGYGKLCLIRSYGREKLCFNTMVDIAGRLIFIVVFQVMIFSVWDRQWKRMDLEKTVFTLLIYYVGLLAIVLLQFCMELFFETQYANVFVNIFILLSLFIESNLILTKGVKWIGICLFPNLLFGTRNGLIYQGNVYIKFNQAALFLTMICILIGILSMIRFRKIDIY